MKLQQLNKEDVRKLLINFTNYINDKSDMYRIPIDVSEVEEFLNNNNI